MRSYVVCGTGKSKAKKMKGSGKRIHSLIIYNIFISTEEKSIHNLET